MKTKSKNNLLATAPIGGLIARYAIPSIISMLVTAAYNIVDQVFIGRGIGVLGNAATNVAFPLSTIVGSLTLLIGIGSAANFNLRMGEGNPERAEEIATNGLVMMSVVGILLMLIVRQFLEPLLLFFGGTPDVMPYAMEYTRVVSLGFPFLLFSSACSHLIRADGNSTYAMLSVLSGAIVNTILDPIFIFTLDWGMAGAAWATVIGQIVSFGMTVWYLSRFQTVTIRFRGYEPELSAFVDIASLGAGASFNQLALLVMQVVLNNTLTKYGAMSIYGSDIPLAAVGVISKVNFIFLSICIGISQGCQPIFGYNYGARNYERVKEAYKKAAGAVLAVGAVGLVAFQFFPRQIISFFGTGDAAYFEFAERYFRIYMMMVLFNGLHPLSSTFFSSIGKPIRGIFVSLTRQLLFLVPLILIFPLFFGIDGVMYAGPIADAASIVLSLLFVVVEMREMTRLQEDNLPQQGNG